jgi:hypothetical protein
MFASPVKPPRQIAVAVFVALAALAAASCGHTVIDKPTSLSGDDWALTIRKVTDGPNSYHEGNVAYSPKKGQRFIWVHLTLRNLRRDARAFNFDRCDLDAGGQAIIPNLIDADMFADLLVKREAQLGGHETIDRRLIYAYPRDQSPTRLSCAPMVMPLPQF